MVLYVLKLCTTLKAMKEIKGEKNMAYIHKYESIDAGLVTKPEMIKTISLRTGFTRKNVEIFLEALEATYETYLMESRSIQLCKGVTLMPTIQKEQVIKTHLLKPYGNPEMSDEITVPPRKIYKVKLTDYIKELWNGSYGKRFFEIRVNDKYISQAKKKTEDK